MLWNCIQIVFYFMIVTVSGVRLVCFIAWKGVSQLTALFKMSTKLLVFFVAKNYCLHIPCLAKYIEIYWIHSNHLIQIYYKIHVYSPMSLYCWFRDFVLKFVITHRQKNKFCFVKLIRLCWQSNLFQFICVRARVRVCVRALECARVCVPVYTCVYIQV